MKIDQLIRSSRKTIAIIVRRDGQLIIRAPQQASTAQIMAFVDSKADWIRQKQAEAGQRQAEQAPRQFAAGESLYFQGKRYPLELVHRTRPMLELANGHFRLAQAAQPRAKEVLTRWYQQQARQVIEPRTQALAALHKLTYQQVRISSARTRWGSCSSRGTLSFTWRLVMAPPAVIDYVIIHELAHLIERNHSSRFWAQVARMLPDYKERVKWLKQNGYRLTLE
jgi:predicted metal-dependent hydrolase